MHITWYGQSCFKISARGDADTPNLVLITDPFGKEIGLKPFSGRADIVTISHEHHDHNELKGIRGIPFIIRSPGEYEVKNVNILGIPSFHDSSQGSQSGENIVYVIEIENIRICHLGDLGSTLSNGQLEKIGQVDILMIPVGGRFTLDGEAADEVVSQIEPKIIIPMHYKVKGLTFNFDSVDKFLKEMGATEKKPLDKLIIKKKDLEGKESEIVILKPANL